MPGQLPHIVVNHTADQKAHSHVDYHGVSMPLVERSLLTPKKIINNEIMHM